MACCCFGLSYSRHMKDYPHSITLPPPCCCLIFLILCWAHWVGMEDRWVQTFDPSIMHQQRVSWGGKAIEGKVGEGCSMMAAVRHQKTYVTVYRCSQDTKTSTSAGRQVPSLHSCLTMGWSSVPSSLSRLMLLCFCLSVNLLFWFTNIYREKAGWDHLGIQSSLFKK